MLLSVVYMRLSFTISSYKSNYSGIISYFFVSYTYIFIKHKLFVISDFQNFLRTQMGNTTTVNIIISTVDYLLRLQVKKKTKTKQRINYSPPLPLRLTQGATLALCSLYTGSITKILCAHPCAGE